MDNRTPLEIAIHRAGSQTALARLIGAKQQNVWDWVNKNNNKASPSYVLAIEAATGVSRHDLRPDIFGPHPQREPTPEVAA